MADFRYRELAASVIRHALLDFGIAVETRGGGSRRRVMRGPPTKISHPERYRWIAQRLEAGEFLFTRRDDVVWLWFNLAGIDLDVYRQGLMGEYPEWSSRLQALQTMKRETGRWIRARFRLDSRGRGRPLKVPPSVLL